MIGARPLRWQFVFLAVLLLAGQAWSLAPRNDNQGEDHETAHSNGTDVLHVKMAHSNWTLSSEYYSVVAFKGDNMTFTCKLPWDKRPHAYTILMESQDGENLARPSYGLIDKNTNKVIVGATIPARLQTKLYVCKWQIARSDKTTENDAFVDAEAHERIMPVRVVHRPRMSVIVSPHQHTAWLPSHGVLLVRPDTRGSVFCSVVSGHGYSVIATLDGTTQNCSRAAAAEIPESCNGTLAGSGDPATDTLPTRRVLCSVPVRIGTLQCSVDYGKATASAAVISMLPYSVPEGVWRMSRTHGNTMDAMDTAQVNAVKNAPLVLRAKFYVQPGRMYGIEIDKLIGDGNDFDSSYGNYYEKSSATNVLLVAHTITKSTTDADSGRYRIFISLTKSFWDRHDTVVEVRVVSRPDMKVFLPAAKVLQREVGGVRTYFVPPNVGSSAVLLCNMRAGNATDIELWRENTPIKEYLTQRELAAVRNTTCTDCLAQSAVVSVQGPEDGINGSTYACRVRQHGTLFQASVKLIQLYPQTITSNKQQLLVESNTTVILADVAITGFPLPEVQVTLPNTLPIGDGIDSTYRLHPDSQSNISVRLDNYSTILLEYTVSKSVLYTATVTGKLVSPLGTPSDGDHLAGNYTFSILNRVLGNGPSQVVIALETETFIVHENVSIGVDRLSSRSIRCELSHEVYWPVTWKWFTNGSSALEEPSEQPLLTSHGLSSLLQLSHKQVYDLREAQGSVLCRSQWRDWNDRMRDAEAVAFVPTEEEPSSDPNITLGVRLNHTDDGLVMHCYLDARLPAADSGDVQWRWRSTASEVVSAGLRWSSTLFVSTTQLNVLLALSRNVTCSVSWLDTDGFRHRRTKIAYHPTEKVHEPESLMSWQNISKSTAIGLGAGIPVVLILVYVVWYNWRRITPYLKSYQSVFSMNHLKELSIGSTSRVFYVIIKTMVNGKVMLEEPAVLVVSKDDPDWGSGGFFGPFSPAHGRTPTTPSAPPPVAPRPKSLALATSPMSPMSTTSARTPVSPRPDPHRTYYEVMLLLQENDAGHRNVIKMIVKYSSLMQHDSEFNGRLVLEYAPHGTLLDYLKSRVVTKKHHCHGYIDCLCIGGRELPFRSATPSSLTVTESSRPPSVTSIDTVQEQREHLTPYMLYDFVNQLAEGMKFVRNKGVVHGDLASRNILIGQGGVLKICDFGHSWSATIDRRPPSTPVRYAPIERLISPPTLCVQNDIWSFGVVIWEMCTLGKDPYESHANGDILQHLLQGNRLPCPRHCSEAVFAVMENCWRTEPEQRCTYEEIQDKFENIPHDPYDGYLQTIPGTEAPRSQTGYVPVEDAFEEITSEHDTASESRSARSDDDGDDADSASDPEDTTPQIIVSSRLMQSLVRPMSASNPALHQPHMESSSVECSVVHKSCDAICVEAVCDISKESCQRSSSAALSDADYALACDHVSMAAGCQAEAEAVASSDSEEGHGERHSEAGFYSVDEE